MRASGGERAAKATHARAFENSPAIHGWVEFHKTKSSPGGTKENLLLPNVLSSLRDSGWLGGTPYPALKRWAIFKMVPSVGEAQPLEIVAEQEAVHARECGETRRKSNSRPRLRK